MGKSRENHGKIMGKPWENHGKTMGQPWENHGDFSRGKSRNSIRKKHKHLGTYSHKKKHVLTKRWEAGTNIFSALPKSIIMNEGL